MHSDLHGPDLLDEYIERLGNNGFHMEAEVLKTCSREWRTDRGEFVPPTPPAPKLMAPAKSIRCAVVGADFGKKYITVEAFGFFEMPFGDCWLVPLEPVE